MAGSIDFLVALLVKAGINRGLATQLAQAYLSAHGVPFDYGRAVEQILEDLARGGGGSPFAGGASLTQEGGGPLPGGLSGGSSGASSSQEEALLQALADASRGTVSAQSLGSYGLSVQEAAGAVAYQVGSQLGEQGSLSTSTYDALAFSGFLDDVALDR
jgi:hypothetical protein